MHVLKHKNPEQFLYTVEFYPEEGRYHLDGHKDCKFSCDPQRTKELGGMCPVCGKQLLRGVLYRVNELGGRPQGVRPPGSIPFRHAVSLEEIIAGVLKVGVGS
jgi:PHP family Zn ribbon phosphoesterase